MKTFNGNHKELERQVVFRVFQLVVGLGLVLSLLLIAKQPTFNADFGLMVYTSWFAIAFVSIEAIIQRLKAGVYALVLATIIVTVVDFTIGEATFGGATLGLLVAYILVAYIRPEWWQFD